MLHKPEHANQSSQESDDMRDNLRQTAVYGHVTTDGGDFIGHDKNIYGDEIHGDKVAGNKIVIIQNAEMPTAKVDKPRLAFEPETVLIAAGPFIMGIDLNDAPDERPQHTVELPHYRIGKYPVTNREYAAFLAHDLTHEAPSKQGWFNRQPPQDRLDHPVAAISWQDACDYCAWLSAESGRTYCLPTEAEWEKAARGADGQLYPWGDTWTVGAANVDSTDTTPVNAYPASAGPTGCQDLLGNVEEWTRTRWGPDRQSAAFLYPYRSDDARNDTSSYSLRDFRIHSGGSFRSNAAHMRATVRDRALPDSRVRWRGFRVVEQLEQSILRNPANGQSI